MQSSSAFRKVLFELQHLQRKDRAGLRGGIRGTAKRIAILTPFTILLAYLLFANAARISGLTMLLVGALGLYLAFSLLNAIRVLVRDSFRNAANSFLQFPCPGCGGALALRRSACFYACGACDTPLYLKDGRAPFLASSPCCSSSAGISPDHGDLDCLNCGARGRVTGRRWESTGETEPCQTCGTTKSAAALFCGTCGALHDRQRPGVLFSSVLRQSTEGSAGRFVPVSDRLLSAFLIAMPGPGRDLDGDEQRSLDSLLGKSRAGILADAEARLLDSSMDAGLGATASLDGHPFLTPECPAVVLEVVAQEVDFSSEDPQLLERVAGVLARADGIYAQALLDSVEFLRGENAMTHPWVVRALPRLYLAARARVLEKLPAKARSRFEPVELAVEHEDLGAVQGQAPFGAEVLWRIRDLAPIEQAARLLALTSSRSSEEMPVLV